MTARYYARSASDKTDDWPIWFVADRQYGGLNVTADLIRSIVDPTHDGATLTTRALAFAIADMANQQVTP